jgi:hypothetical protein
MQVYGKQKTARKKASQVAESGIVLHVELRSASALWKAFTTSATNSTSQLWPAAYSRCDVRAYDVASFARVTVRQDERIAPAFATYVG